MMLEESASPGAGSGLVGQTRTRAEVNRVFMVMAIIRDQRNLELKVYHTNVRAEKWRINAHQYLLNFRHLWISLTDLREFYSWKVDTQARENLLQKFHLWNLKEQNSQNHREEGYLKGAAGRGNKEIQPKGTNCQL